MGLREQRTQFVQNQILNLDWNLWQAGSFDDGIHVPQARDDVVEGCRRKVRSRKNLVLRAYSIAVTSACR
jgi:hypothetical protein